MRYGDQTKLMNVEIIAKWISDRNSTVGSGEEVGGFYKISTSFDIALSPPDIDLSENSINIFLRIMADDELIIYINGNKNFCGGLSDISRKGAEV